MIKNCQQTFKFYQKQTLKSNGMTLPVSLNYYSMFCKVLLTPSESPWDEHSIWSIFIDGTRKNVAWIGFFCL